MPKQSAKKSSTFFPYNLRRLSKSLNSIPEDTNSSSSSSDTNSINMATEQNNSGNSTQAPIVRNTNTNDIFNSLRIPDAIKDLPKFDGNPRLLYEFLNNVEEILLYIRGTDNTPYGQILLRAIRNKVEGQANEVLNMYETPLICDEIKRT